MYVFLGRTDSTERVIADNKVRELTNPQRSKILQLSPIFNRAFDWSKENPSVGVYPRTFYHKYQRGHFTRIKFFVISTYLRIVNV